MTDDPRVKAIEERLNDPEQFGTVFVDDVAFLLEDRKRLIGEIKRIESYCAEVEIARRAAESEVAALKTQIAEVDSDEFFSRVFNALPSSGRVYFSKRRGAVTWPEIRHAVRAALSTGNGERK